MSNTSGNFLAMLTDWVLLAFALALYEYAVDNADIAVFLNRRFFLIFAICSTHAPNGLLMCLGGRHYNSRKCIFRCGKRNMKNTGFFTISVARGFKLPVKCNTRIFTVFFLFSRISDFLLPGFIFVSCKRKGDLSLYAERIRQLQ